MLILKKAAIPLVVVLVGVLVAVPVVADEDPTHTTISNVLEGQVKSQQDMPWIDLTWGLADEDGHLINDLDDDYLQWTLVVGEPGYINVRAENVSHKPLARVVFLIEAEDVFDIEYWCDTAEQWEGPLDYEAIADGTYSYGPSDGFELVYPYASETRFKVTATAPCDYNVKMYAVKLDG